jgi:hypothetical protein
VTGDHRPEEVAVQGVDAPSLGRGLGRRVCRLPEDEPAEEHLAPPVGRVADPPVAVGTDDDGLDRLGDDGVDVELGLCDRAKVGPEAPPGPLD